MSIHDTVADPAIDELSMTDAEFRAAHDLGPRQRIESVVQANALDTLERLAAITARAYRS